MDLGLPDCEWDGCDQKNQRMVGNTDYRRVGEGIMDHEKAAALDTGADDYLTKYRFLPLS